MTSIFPEKPDTRIPVARQIALAQLDNVDAEAQRRVGMHRDFFNAFWHSPEATPQEIADEMGTSGHLWWISAQLNVKWIAEFCEAAGLDVVETLGAEYLQRPAEVTVNEDGTLKIS